MRVKTFRARDIADAMRQVRRELGEDAIILSSQESGGGAEVVAAIEDRSPVGVAPFANATAPLAAALKTAERIDHRMLTRSLAFHGLSAGLIERLLEATSGHDDVLTGLSAALEENFGFEPLSAEMVQPVMLVGPPGSGKTVTVAKIAARFVLARRPLAIATCDTERAGGVSQLSAFTDILKRPLATAAGPDDLSRFIADAPAGHAVVIDTPGINPFEPRELAGIEAAAEAAQAEPVLVLPAGLDPAEAVDIATAFAAIGARRLLLTRADTTRRIGAAIMAAAQADLSFAEVSVTPYIGEGLLPMSAAALARLMLRDPSQAHPLHVLGEVQP